jgi:hypothetical protein
VQSDQEAPLMSTRTSNRDYTKQGGRGSRGTEDMRTCRGSGSVESKGTKIYPVLEDNSELEEPKTRDARHEV